MSAWAESAAHDPSRMTDWARTLECAISVAMRTRSEKLTVSLVSAINPAKCPVRELPAGAAASSVASAMTSFWQAFVTLPRPPMTREPASFEDFAVSSVVVQLSLANVSADLKDVTSIAPDGRGFLFLSGSSGIRKVGAWPGPSRGTVVASSSLPELARASLAFVHPGHLLAFTADGAAHVLDPSTLAPVRVFELPAPARQSKIVTDGVSLFAIHRPTKDPTASMPLSGAIVERFAVSVGADSVSLQKRGEVTIKGVDNVSNLATSWTNGAEMVIACDSSIVTVNLETGAASSAKKGLSGYRVSYDPVIHAIWTSQSTSSSVQIGCWLVDGVPAPSTVSAIAQRTDWPDQAFKAAASGSSPLPVEAVSQALFHFLEHITGFRSRRIAAKIFPDFTTEDASFLEIAHGLIAFSWKARASPSPASAETLRVSVQLAHQFLASFEGKDLPPEHAPLGDLLLEIAGSSQDVDCAALAAQALAFLCCVSNSKARLSFIRRVLGLLSEDRLAPAPAAGFMTVLSARVRRILDGLADIELETLLPSVGDALITCTQKGLKDLSQLPFARSAVLSFFVAMLAHLRYSVQCGGSDSHVKSVAQQLPQNVISVLEVARSLLDALDPAKFPAESQSKFFETIDTTFGALVEQFSPLIRGLKLTAQESTRVMAPLIAAIDLTAAITARWPTQKGRLVQRTFVAESMHPHGCSVTSEWSFDFGGSPANEITVNFAPETSFPGAKLFVNTDKEDSHAFENSCPPTLKVAGTRINFKFHAGRYTDGESSYGFKAAASAPMEEARWLPLLSGALSEAVVSLFADSNALAAAATAAPDPVLSSKLFENGLLGTTAKLGEGEKLILELAEAQATPRTAALMKMMTVPDAVAEDVRRLAQLVFAALLWHKNVGSVTQAVLESKTMNRAVAVAWSEALSLAEKTIRSEQDPGGSELEQKCRLLLKLAPCGAPVRRMLTESIIDMRRKFYTSPSRQKNKAAEALEALNSWKQSLRTSVVQFRTGALSASSQLPPGTMVEPQDLVLEFLRSGQPSAASLGRELLGAADRCEIRASLLRALASVLRGCKGNVDGNLIKFLAALSSAMGATSIFASIKGAPQSSVDRLRSALFALLGELAALLSESSAPPGTSPSIVELVRRHVLRIWHCDLGSGSEDYVVKTQIIPALQRILASLDTGDLEACTLAWHLLASLVVYCFRESGGDETVSRDPSCRGFIAGSLASQLSTVLAQVATPATPAPAPAPLPSGQSCTLVVSTLLVLCQAFKTFAPLVAEQVHTKVLFRLLATSWSVYSSQVLILRLLRFILPFRTPTKILVKTRSGKKVHVIDWLIDQVGCLLAPELPQLDGVAAYAAPDAIPAPRDQRAAAGMECAMALRLLATVSAWKPLIWSRVQSLLDATRAVLDLFAPQTSSRSLLKPEAQNHVLTPDQWVSYLHLDAVLIVLGGISDLPRIGGRAAPRTMTNFLRTDSTNVVGSFWQPDWPALGFGVPVRRRQPPRLYFGQAKVLTDVVPPVPEMPLAPLIANLLTFASTAVDESWAGTTMGHLRERLALHSSRVALHVFESVPAVVAELASAGFSTSFLRGIAEAGMVPSIPRKVLECVPLALEQRMSVRLHRSPPPLLLSLGRACVHAEGMGILHAHVLLPPAWTAADCLLSAPCIYVVADEKKEHPELFPQYDESRGRGQGDDADRSSSGEESDSDRSRDRSPSPSSSSSSSSRSSSHHSEYESGTVSEVSSFGFDLLGIAAGSGSGSGIGSEPDSEIESDSGTESESGDSGRRRRRRRRRSPKAARRREKPSEGTSKDAEKKKKESKKEKEKREIAQHFVTEKPSAECVKGKIVLLKLKPEESTIEGVMGKLGSIVEAGGVGAVFVVRASKLAEILKAIGKDDVKVPLAVVPRQGCKILKLVIDECRRRHTVTSLCAKLPEHADNVLCQLNETREPRGIVGVLKSKKHESNPSAPERIPADLRASTALIEFGRKGHDVSSFEGIGDSACLRGNMYHAEDPFAEDDETVFYPFMTPRRALRCFIKDLLAASTTLLGAWASLSCQQCALYLVNAPAANLAASSPLAVAHLLLAANAKPLGDSDNILRRHLVVFPSPPPTASMAVATAIQLIRATPKASQSPTPLHPSESPEPVTAKEKGKLPETAKQPTPEEKEKMDKGKGKSKTSFWGNLRSRRHKAPEKKEEDGGVKELVAKAQEKEKRKPKKEVAPAHSNIQRALVFVVTTALKQSKANDGKGLQQAIGAMFLIQGALMPVLRELDRAEVQQLHAALAYAISRSNDRWLREGCCRLATDLLCTLEEAKTPLVAAAAAAAAGTATAVAIPKGALVVYEKLWTALQGSPERGSSVAAAAELALTAKRIAPATVPKNVSKTHTAMQRLAPVATLIEWTSILTRGPSESTAEFLAKQSLEIDPMALAPGMWTAEMDVALLKQFAPEGKWKDAEFRPVDGLTMPTGAGPKQLHDRAKAVFAFFEAVKDSVEKIDWYGSEWRPRSIARRVGAFFKTHVWGPGKQQIVKAAVRATQENDSFNKSYMSQVSINRFLAGRAVERGDIARTAFAQMAWRVLPEGVSAMNSFDVQFAGEGSIDAGGLFCDLLSLISGELMSGNSLFIQCPNGRFSTGNNRDKFLPKPSLVSAYNLSLFSFLGVLGNVVMYRKCALSLNLPSIFWKPICGERVTLDDLRAVDGNSSCIEHLRTLENTPESEELLEELQFTAVLTDGSEVELKPGGRSTSVTWETRNEFCDLMEQAMLHAYDRQVAAVRRGFASLFPIAVADCLLTWRDLEVAICSESKLDLARLKEDTSYGGQESTDQLFVWLWEVLSEYEPAEQTKFLRFVTGLERMPASGKFGLRLSVEDFSNPDSNLPHASTCSRNLQLPRYSSKTVLRDRITYAINSCSTLDGDSDPASRRVYAEEY